MADEERVLLALEDTASTGVRVAGLRILSYGIGFAASVAIARALGPTGRGLYALPVAFLGIVMAFSHVGLEHANVYLASRHVAIRRLWGSSVAVALLVSIAAWIVVAVLRSIVGPSFLGGLPLSWVLVTVGQVPLLLTNLYWVGLLQLDGRLRKAIEAVVAATAIHAAAVIALFAADALTPFRVLALTGLLNGAMWLFVLGLGARAGLASAAVEWPLLRRAITFGVKAHVATVFTFLLLRADQLLVERELGFEALGLYSLAAVLSELLWLVTDPFAASLLPYQVRAPEGDERRLGFATARLALVVAVAGGALAWVLAPYAIRLAYGAAFGGAVWPFRLLLPGICALALQRPLGAILLKEGRVLLSAAINAGALALNVVLNLILLPRIGIEGASLASSVTYGALAIGYVIAVRREGVVSWRDLVPGRRDVARLAAAFRLPGRA